jgi:SNF2 family DNA or RNA helicase
MFLDMGLGKTVVTLSAIADLIAGLEIRAALVVAPIRVIESVWPQEAQKWDHLRHLKIVVVRGSAKERLAKLAEPADIYLINFEQLIWLSDIASRMKVLPWDMMVFDESTKMKSASARRFKRTKPMLPRCKRFAILTGTPTPNSYMDLWAQIYLLDGGARLGEFVTYFRERYFDYNPWTYELKLKPGAAKQIRDKIRDLVMCLRSEDYLKLPPCVETVIPVDLPPKVLDLYHEFEEELFIKVQDTEVEAFNAAALSMKCRQLTSGAVYDVPSEEGPRKWQVVHDAKLDALEDVIEEANGEPLLVVYEFRHELARLLARWPKTPWIGGGSKDSGAIIDQWNKGKLKLLFVHPASVGHGVNLQFGGRLLVWTSGTWSYELYEQMAKRLHRQGQTKPVMVYLLVARGTVDETVAEVLRGKRQGLAELMAALRARAEAASGKRRGN